MSSQNVHVVADRNPGGGHSCGGGCGGTPALLKFVLQLGSTLKLPEPGFETPR